MVDVPVLAVCEICGTLFRVPNLLSISGPGTTTNVRIRGSVERACTRCGGTLRIVDATYDMVGGVLKVLFSPARSREELELLRGILEEARATRATTADISARIHEAAPQLAAVADALARAPGPVWQYIAILIAVLGFLLQSATAWREFTKPDLSAAEIQALITRAAQASSRSPQTATTAPKARATPRPNEPCLCGSGRPYKKCHGKPRKGRR
jgi:hypothetical protein